MRAALVTLRGIVGSGSCGSSLLRECCLVDWPLCSTDCRSCVFLVPSRRSTARRCPPCRRGRWVGGNEAGPYSKPSSACCDMETHPARCWPYTAARCKSSPQTYWHRQSTARGELPSASVGAPRPFRAPRRPRKRRGRQDDRPDRTCQSADAPVGASDVDPPVVVVARIDRPGWLSEHYRRGDSISAKAPGYRLLRRFSAASRNPSLRRNARSRDWSLCDAVHRIRRHSGAPVLLWVVVRARGNSPPGIAACREQRDTVLKRIRRRCKLHPSSRAPFMPSTSGSSTTPAQYGARMHGSRR